MSHENRMKLLEENKKCPILGVPYKKLSQTEWDFINKFIEENRKLPDSAFKGKAHYLFIDKMDRPKNHIAIIEVLMATCKPS